MLNYSLPNLHNESFPATCEGIVSCLSHNDRRNEVFSIKTVRKN